MEKAMETGMEEAMEKGMEICMEKDMEICMEKAMEKCEWRANVIEDIRQIKSLLNQTIEKDLIEKELNFLNRKRYPSKLDEYFQYIGDSKNESDITIFKKLGMKYDPNLD